MTAQQYFQSFFAGWDWRAALLAALFALPWLVLLARGYLRRPWLWAAVGAAALLFSLSIAWLVVPVQLWLQAIESRLLGGWGDLIYALPVHLPSIAFSALTQEVVKLLVAIAALRLSGLAQKGRAGLALGAAAGAGYGGFEAFYFMNQIFAQGLTWGTVQLAGPQVLLGYVERFFAVPFHIGAAALAAYGCASGRPWRFLLLAFGLHTLVNFTAVGMMAALGRAARPWQMAGVELLVGAVAAATMAGALALRSLPDA